jgi:hypothetical protein
VELTSLYSQWRSSLKVRQEGWGSSFKITRRKVSGMKNGVEKLRTSTVVVWRLVRDPWVEEPYAGLLHRACI